MNKKETKRLTMRPAHTIVAGFIILILIGSFFLALPLSSKSGVWTNYFDSLFTSTSAVCVTGFTLRHTAEYFSGFGQAVILILIQIGGLGFMTATTFIIILIGKKITFKERLAIQNALSHDTVKGIVKLVRSIFILTFSIELAGALIMLPVFCIQNGAIGIWQAIFTSVSAFCNAGFDIFQSASLTGYVSSFTVNITVCVLIILGGIGFAVILDAVKNKGHFKKFNLHSKVALATTGILIIFGWIFFFSAEFSNPQTLKDYGFGTKILAGFFQSVTSRTAGFYTISQSGLTQSSKLIRDILMFIGACPGSTGGGIKTTTVAILLLMIISAFKNREYVIVNRHTLSNKNILKAMTILLLSVMVTVLLAVFLLFSEQNNPALNGQNLYSLENIVHLAFSAFSTVGIYTELVPLLSTGGKIAIMITIFMARIGLMNMGLLFFNNAGTDNIKYPNGEISVS